MIKVRAFLTFSLYNSTFLRLLIQNYFLLCLTTFLIYKRKVYFDVWQSVINSLFSFFIGVCILLLPFATFYFIRRNNNILERRFFKYKYSSLIENLNIPRDWAQYYMVIFFAKRLILAFTIQFFGSVAQISINMMLSVLLLCYLIIVKPMDSKLLNATEFVNELTFLTCLYICY